MSPTPGPDTVSGSSDKTAESKDEICLALSSALAGVPCPLSGPCAPNDSLFSGRLTCRVFLFRVLTRCFLSHTTVCLKVTLCSAAVVHSGWDWLMYLWAIRLRRGNCNTISEFTHEIIYFLISFFCRRGRLRRRLTLSELLEKPGLQLLGCQPVQMVRF